MLSGNCTEDSRCSGAQSSPGPRQYGSEHDNRPGDVAVSSVFHPHINILPVAADTVLVSTDNVYFYVHSGRLTQQSSNNFDSIFPVQAPSGESVHAVPMRDTAQVLNVVMHTVYGMPCGQFDPTNDELSAAVMALNRYGVQLAVHIAPGRPLFALLVSRTLGAPLFVYTLAAEYDLYPLAAQASGFLLGTKPTEIPQECAERMGAMYLHRLLSLQASRREAMREILRALPRAHPVTRRCGDAGQEGLANAWLLTSGYLIWDGRADLTPTSMSVTFEGVAASIQCEMCKACFFERLSQALEDWAGVARTI